MFQFFKKKFSPAPLKDAGPTIIDAKAMTLEERKQWRLEMLKKSIKDTLTSLEILSGMYRYRLSALDERAHYYAVMMETTKLFADSRHATGLRLQQIEELIKQNCFAEYGVAIDAVYWKVNETVDVFEANARIKPAVPVERRKARTLEAQFQDTIREERRQPEPEYDTSPDTVPYEPFSPEEEAAFRAAIARGLRPPPVHVGEKKYETDLAPLGLY
jgi:hypothetical protein